MQSGNFDAPSVSASFASLKKIKAYTFLPSADEATENHKKFIRWKIDSALKSN